MTVSRCYLSYVSDVVNGDNKYHDNTIIIDCRVNCWDAMSLSKNAVFRNCVINFLGDVNESAYPALIENCNIPLFVYTSSYKQPYAIYRECFIGLYKNDESTETPVLNLYSPSEFHDCIFFYSYYYVSGSNYSKAWNINFNSCIAENTGSGGSMYGITANTFTKLYNSFEQYSYNGVTVGPEDVKLEPSIPKITESEIDAKTDEKGTLHVKISATAND